MALTYSKKDKLKSRKLIEKLFSEGRSIAAYPLRMVYLKTSFDDGVAFKAGVSVSKRNFKKAVQRNHIKRLMREAYRCHKSTYFNNSSNEFALMILYIGKETVDFALIEKKMQQLLNKFSEKELTDKTAP
ncbi:ribonuclease P protein component [Subsaximicrobium wynnwilliamsii]|jgi:ribonuclease P protein component|uniref:Ribonuclease P protein component n=1 Tax=Subsaximicrobium wynnwilliamsii TaxID=291179 RepID=A0A5C6ZFL7_9FLAO|nr:ribonuclease P protein component [Subsaximicrobium wynnwilliamsii]TXD82645.1 ribonuclease P protein component [Subsaximicrobium wynnwilliamsii]TXD88380.1 ribonuclease P protein component [Subsaximicrobium wynnwilliamsii]TXE02307.1 ribonuclease P protein component [Subsaximicrobium wynnwilliamsii]